MTKISILSKLWQLAENFDKTASSFTIPSLDAVNQTKLLCNTAHVSAFNEPYTARKAIDGVEIDFGGIAKGYIADQIKSLLKESGIDPVSKASSISPDQLKKLGKVMKEFAFKITDTNGFDNAQTCVGGVPTKEVDAGTLESKIHKGLYIVGELLDVDGTCGGYNLQWAWSSGMVAGTAASSTGKASSKK